MLLSSGDTLQKQAVNFLMNNTVNYLHSHEAKILELDRMIKANESSVLQCQGS